MHGIRSRDGHVVGFCIGAAAHSRRAGRFIYLLDALGAAGLGRIGPGGRPRRRGAHEAVWPCPEGLPERVFATKCEDLTLNLQRKQILKALLKPFQMS